MIFARYFAVNFILIANFYYFQRTFIPLVESTSILESISKKKSLSSELLSSEQNSNIDLKKEFNDIQEYWLAISAIRGSGSQLSSSNRYSLRLIQKLRNEDCYWKNRQIIREYLSKFKANSKDIELCCNKIIDDARNSYINRTHVPLQVVPSTSNSIQKCEKLPVPGSGPSCSMTRDEINPSASRETLVSNRNTNIEDEDLEKQMEKMPSLDEENEIQVGETNNRIEPQIQTNQEAFMSIPTNQSYITGGAGAGAGAGVPPPFGVCSFLFLILFLYWLFRRNSNRLFKGRNSNIDKNKPKIIISHELRNKIRSELSELSEIKFKF
jgi:hypothetical protein